MSELKKYEDLSMEEENKLLDKIEAAFIKEVLEPRKQPIIDMLVNVLTFKEGYGLIDEAEKLEVIDIYYYAPNPLSFLFVEASYGFYSEKFKKERIEINFDSYLNTSNIIKKVLIDNQIFDGDFYYYDIWDEDRDLFYSFLLKCWEEAKKVTNSKIVGFLRASDGAGLQFLDDGSYPNDFKIDEFLNERGIYPNMEFWIEENKEIEDEPKPSFLSKIKSFFNLK